MNFNDMDYNQRREAVMHAALMLARKQGYNQITRDGIAEQAGVSIGLVSKYFGTMIKLRRQLMRTAVREEWLDIIAQGLAARDPHARKAPDDVKKKALERLTK